MYVIATTPTFLNELLAAPREVQKRVNHKMVLLQEDPYSVGGEAKKIKQYGEHVYAFRLGRQHRVFYSIGRNAVNLLALRARDEAYEARDIGADVPEELDAPEADLDEAAPVPSDHAAPTPIIESELEERGAELDVLALRAPQEPDAPQPTRELPTTISDNLLKRCHVPARYAATLKACRTEDDLLNADVPDEFRFRMIDVLFERPIEYTLQESKYLVESSEQLDAWVHGDLKHFLLRLDEEQEKLVDWRLDGPTLVKGGPGTGKSTVALYRVRALIRHLGGNPRVLFSTYTSALTQVSRSLLTALMGEEDAKRVAVATTDSVALGIARRAHPNLKPANGEEAKAALREALARFQPSGANLVEARARKEALNGLKPDYLLEEMASVIEGWGYARDEYLQAPRPGRNHPLSRSLRDAMYDLYEAWQAELKKRNLVSWGWTRSRALGLVRSGEYEGRYDAVIIDEAQDLTPTALRLLVELAGNPRGLYLTADANQALYARGFAWSRIHESLRLQGRTAILKRNYRNTRQIVAAASDILRDSADDPEATTLEPASDGPVPQLALVAAGEVAACIAQFLRSESTRWRFGLNACAILTPSTRDGEKLAAALASQGVSAQFMAGKGLDLEANCVKVTTLHSSKGLEFPVVVVAGLADGQLPRRNPGTPPEERKAEIAEQKRLFYVGCTRAMRSLLVTGDQLNPSSFLETLETEHWERIQPAVKA